MRITFGASASSEPGRYNLVILIFPLLSPSARAKPRPMIGKYFCFTTVCKSRSVTVLPRIILDCNKAISGADCGCASGSI